MKKYFLIPLFIIFTAYSLFWFYLANRVENELSISWEDYKKSLPSTIKIHQEGIKVQGYPFAFDVAIINPQVQVFGLNQTHDAALHLDGLLTIGTNLTGKLITVRSDGKINFKQGEATGALDGQITQRFFLKKTILTPNKLKSLSLDSLFEDLKETSLELDHTTVTLALESAKLPKITLNCHWEEDRNEIKSQESQSSSFLAAGLDNTVISLLLENKLKARVSIKGINDPTLKIEIFDKKSTIKESISAYNRFAKLVNPSLSLFKWKIQKFSILSSNSEKSLTELLEAYSDKKQKDPLVFLIAFSQGEIASINGQNPLGFMTAASLFYSWNVVPFPKK